MKSSKSSVVLKINITKLTGVLIKTSVLADDRQLLLGAKCFEDTAQEFSGICSCLQHCSAPELVRCLLLNFSQLSQQFLLTAAVYSVDLRADIGCYHLRVSQSIICSKPCVSNVD